MSKSTPGGGNPEDLVIADIDALIDDCMARGVDEHGHPLDNYNSDRYDKCETCHGDWHGLPDEGGLLGCPGAYGSETDKELYEVAQFRLYRPYRGHHGHFPVIPRQRALNEVAGALQEVGESLSVETSTWVTSEVQGTGEPLVLASPEMTDALTEHVHRHPEDEETLMRRFRHLIFTPDGRPVPWTYGGLCTVLGGDNHRVEWAMRQQGFVHIGYVEEVRERERVLLHPPHGVLVLDEVMTVMTVRQVEP